MPRQILPQLIDDTLQPLAADGTPLPAIVIGSGAWFAWLEGVENRAFSVSTNDGAVTARRERQGSGWYWYAYRRQGPKLRKAYLGKAEDLTPARLRAAIQSLAPAVGDVEPGTTAAENQLRLCIFGMPQCIRGDQPISAPASKAVALLAYLALRATPQRRDHLLALLWPESAEEAARKNLRNVLWSIRATLGEDVLLVQGERLALQADVWVDVQVFERLAQITDHADRMALEEALALYRGPLLDGLSIADATDFDLWLTTERERLTQLFSRSAERLLDLERAAGAWDAIIPVAQRVLTHDPLQEWPYRILMEAHARRGDRATALRQYDLLRSMLDRELDVAPSPETEAVHDAIVRGVFERVAARPPQRAPVRMNRPSTAPFVGRQVERITLDAELVTAMAGSVRIAVLSGEMGIGKSRLWQVWAAGVGSAVTVLEARCLLSTQQMPFAPLIALFSHRIWLDRFAAVADAAQPTWLEDLSPLLPTLQETLARPLISRFQPEDERHRVFEAFMQALQAIAAPPLVFFLDDIQWADSTTLDWLDYLAHRGRELSLLLVLAYRSEDASRALLQRIAQWDRDGLVQRLKLNRLTREEGAALLQALDARVHDFTRVYEAGAGNPYFLSEMAHAPPGDLPPALADLVRARLDHLPEVAQHVLQVAAVLEPDIDPATIWQIAGRDEDETLDALDTLLRTAILTEHEERYTFTHPLVSTLVREDLSRARRATLHRRAATALEQIYATRLPAQAGRIMYHFREAGNLPQVARYAELAGDYALTVAAPVEAAYFYEQAIAIEQTAARLLGLGRAHIWGGDLDAGCSAFERALALFQQAADHSGAAWISLQLADIGTMRSQFDLTMQFAKQALELAGDVDQAVAAAAHVLIGSSLRIQGAPLPEAEAHIMEAIRLATMMNLPDMLTYCYVGLSNIRADQGDMQGAFAAAQEIVRYARQSGNDFYEAVGYNNSAYRALLLGNYQGAHEYLEAGLRLVEERVLEVPRQWLYSTRGELALAEEEWDEAERWFQRGIVHAERNGNQAQIAMYYANLGLAARGRGDLTRAVQLLEQAQANTTHETAAFQQTQIDLWLAETYAQQEDYVAADRSLARAEERLAMNAHPYLQQGIAALRERLVAR
jgi:DNA-binding SARP family transcriptional activator